MATQTQRDQVQLAQNEGAIRETRMQCDRARAAAHGALQKVRIEYVLTDVSAACVTLRRAQEQKAEIEAAMSDVRRTVGVALSVHMDHAQQIFGELKGALEDLLKEQHDCEAALGTTTSRLSMNLLASPRSH